MSITKIQFPDSTFDYMICNHVLEHVPDDQAAMDEAYRVLKPGGKFLVQVPINYESTMTLEDPTFDRLQRRAHYGGQHHLRYYSAQALIAKLNATGFATEAYTADTDLNTELHGIDPDEIQFVAVKP